MRKESTSKEWGFFFKFKHNSFKLNDNLNKMDNIDYSNNVAEILAI